MHRPFRKERFVEIARAGTELPKAQGIIAVVCSEDRVSPDNMHGNCRPVYAHDWWSAEMRARLLALFYGLWPQDS